MPKVSARQERPRQGQQRPSGPRNHPVRALSFGHRRYLLMSVMVPTDHVSAEVAVHVDSPLIAVSAVDAGMRLDRWFQRRYPQVAYATLQSWLRKGLIKIDGKKAKGPERLEEGQQIRVPRSSQVSAPAAAAAMAASSPKVGERRGIDLRERLLYSDDALVVLNKPAGLATQGGSKLALHLEMLTHTLSRDGERLHLVHRLDKDTSGVLVMARNSAIAAHLAEAFRDGRVEKRYWAVVRGVPDVSSGRVELPLKKRATAEGERVVVDPEGGSPAITCYQKIARFGRSAAWLALEPMTGRTHQLRVHCAALGHPILGDRKYGGEDAPLPEFNLAQFDLGEGLHLHAQAIRLTHPSGRVLTITAPLPPHMQTTFKIFGFDEELAGDSFSRIAGERRHKPSAPSDSTTSRRHVRMRRR